jgi:hypothetical protein
MSKAHQVRWHLVDAGIDSKVKLRFRRRGGLGKRAAASEFITGCSRVTRALLKISSPCISPIRFLSRCLCVSRSVYTRSFVFFFYWRPRAHPSRGKSGRFAFFFPSPMRDCNADMIFMRYIVPHYITVLQFARKMI